ncbi:glycosyltransferase family 4 protein [Sporolactobacillus vineae]|uniref:glycosyltransferase family 4 protein n=1 Tax=Sporolactobacillus vineae TaxID=444463 RepID=UPI0002898475|nr:glycosyltransferase family 4 protein [Sporolactobacillus vineae]
MKIAMIGTEKLPVPAIRGGAIQIYIQSSAELLAVSEQVTVFSIKDPDLKDEETVGGIHYIRLNRESYVTELAGQLSRGQFEVVHLCNRPAWLEHLKKAAPDSRFVLSVHNEMFTETKMSRESGEKCIDSAAEIITVSDYIGKTITERFPDAAEKVRTVYSGVDLNTFRPAWTDEGAQIRKIMREKAGLEGKHIILFVGRLSKVKGPHILLQAIPAIAAEHPEAMLVFIGSKWFGDDRVNNYVRHLYTLGAMFPEQVTFIKFVRPSDIPFYYAMSDLFVCSSQWQEPLARVHYEAMAAGLPVITTNRGGNGEVIREGQNGFVIDDFDQPEMYARRINTLLGDSELRDRMGRSGRQTAEEKFGWKRVAENLMTVYRSAAQKK